MTNYYQIAFDPPVYYDVASIHSFVTTEMGIGDWWHYIGNIYIVKSAATSFSLANKIITRFPGVNFIIIKVDINDFNGYLRKEAWDWFADQARQKVGYTYVPNAQSPVQSAINQLLKGDIPPQPKNLTDIQRALDILKKRRSTG